MGTKTLKYVIDMDTHVIDMNTHVNDMATHPNYMVDTLVNDTSMTCPCQRHGYLDAHATG